MLKSEIIEIEGSIRITRIYDSDTEYPDPDELERLGQMRLPQLKIIDMKGED